MSCLPTAVITAVLGVVLPFVAAAQTSERVARLNRAFLEHLDTLPVQQAQAAELVRQGWRETYSARMPESFVSEALSVLFEDFAKGLRAFDNDRPAEALRLLGPLRDHADPYLAANATYFHARAMVARGMLEEADAQIDARLAARPNLTQHTAFAPQLWFLKAASEANCLRNDQARESLKTLGRLFPDAPEPVRVGARQLALEIERRENGTLDEVSRYMDYAADRLYVTDATERVRERQQRAVDLLDALIEQAQRKEQQQSQGKGARGGKQGRGGSPQNLPQSAAPSSTAPEGGGKIGDLHGAPKANPGQMWGKLPPAERERILQNLRERFPSRYRQLVEQYYRSLAEEK